jgi:regulator of nucleoside diphosphate kinase
MGLFGRILPPILVGEGDRHDLVVLALGGAGHSADQADDLLYELGRAAVVDDEALPPDVVRMGSAVVASINGGNPEHSWLSYPHDVGPNGLSILSPAGTALLGLRAGQSMRWTDRDGKINDVHVVAVNNRRIGSDDPTA